MKATNVDNPGIASIITVTGEKDKDLEVTCAVIMGKNDVLETPLAITSVETHTCEVDEKRGIATRTHDGKTYQANLEQMKQTRDQRINSGKPVYNEKGENITDKIKKVAGELEI